MGARLDQDGFPVKEAHPNVFEIYNREARGYDIAMVERWRTAMEGLLIFAGLFSAAVTAFIIESYKTLQPDPNEEIVALLSQIAQQLSNTPSPILNLPEPTSFSVPWTAVATNILWFISLGLSLACAVTATLVQQWARNYIHTIEQRPSAERRARMRMYLFEGIEQFGMSRIIDGVPALIHLALFTFLLGLVFFINPVSLPVTIVGIIILITSVLAYMFATLLPLVAYHSPIQTPLTSVVWQRSFIKFFYCLCAHTLFVAQVIKLLAAPPLDATWTIIDLVVRQILPRLKLRSAAARLTRARSGGISLLRTKRRIELLRYWSPDQVKADTLDATRAEVARDSRVDAFWKRERNAFIWLVKCLDEDREILPFIEAIPFSAGDVFQYWTAPSLRPETLSAVLLHSDSALHNRLIKLRYHHTSSRRVHTTLIDFYSGLPNETLTALFTSDHDLLHHLMLQLGPPDVRTKLIGLQTIAIVAWGLSVAIPQSCDQYLIDTVSPWNHPLLIRHFSRRNITLLGESVWRPKVPYFGLARFYLMVLPCLTAEDIDWAAAIILRLHWQLYNYHRQNDSWPSVFPGGQSLFCATLQILISVLESCNENIMYTLMGPVTSLLFGDLSYISEEAAFEIVHEILESPFWTKFPGLDRCFKAIVDGIDEARNFTVSHSIRQKHKLSQLTGSLHPPTIFHAIEIIASLDLRGADTDLQRFFITRSANLLYSSEQAGPEPGFDANIIFFEAMMEVFYLLDDLFCLQGALRVTERFLAPENYPYHQLGLECRDYLRTMIFEKSRRTVAVQVNVPPERAVQVG